MKTVNVWLIINLLITFLGISHSQAQDFSAPLPLIKIEADDWIKVPKKKRKIPAKVLLLERPAANEYSCNTSERLNIRKDVRPIKIRIRGNITTKFPKKGYQIEYVDAKDSEKEESISLLNMTSSDKWALIGPYFDRSLARNSLAFDLASKLKDEKGNKAWYVPQYRFVELMLNCHYLGIYTLVEKVERDKKRVDIGKFDFDNPETSPFMLKRDGKGFGVNPAPGETFTTHWKNTWTYDYPSDKKINAYKKKDPAKYAQIKKSILKRVEKLDATLSDITPSNQKDGEWEKLIDIPSFINFILMQEVTKNVDGFRRSVHIFSDDKGIIHMGPIWDFDTSLGILWFYNQHNPQGFQHGHRSYIDGNNEMFWFRRLLNNRKFASMVVDAYYKERKKGGAFSSESIEEIFSSFDRQLNPEALKRNFNRWRVLGRPPLVILLVAPPYPRTHAGEMKKLQNWLTKRLDWLDANMKKLAD